MIRDFVILMRPRQWVKNLFIFLPLFFALRITDLSLLVRAGMAFICFCFLAGGIYTFNDYHDREEDKRHPRKKMRPLAAGRVSAKAALTMAALLVISGMVGSWLLGINLFYLAFFYLLLNIFYTLKIKHVAILDIFSVALGFVIRIFVGGFVTGLTIYPWIVVMTFLLALFLAIGKRREDVVIFMQNARETRKSVNGYTLHFIDNAMIAMAAITIVSYLMYTMSEEVTAKFGTDYLYVTAVFVMLGLMRYLQITMVEGRSADPTDVLLRDKFIQIVLAGWIITFGLLIYSR